MDDSASGITEAKCLQKEIFIYQFENTYDILLCKVVDRPQMALKCDGDLAGMCSG